ncbi:MAG: tetratricopeptide repeat protein [Deltaproteobacteria bacterium]|nr:tetratricopeptide repeat protein [Deltaproteobacteria bacterium]
MMHRNILTVALAALSLGVCTQAHAQAHRETAARDAVAKASTDAAASLNLAKVLRRSGSYDAALAELRRGGALASARAGDVAIRFKRETALVYLDQGKYEQAMTACRGLGALKGADALGHACLAEAHMLHKRATEALPEVTKALAASPTLYEAKVIEGYVRWQEAAPAEAEAAFRAAAASDGARTEAWLGLGRFLVANSRKAQGLEAFEKAVAADGDDPESLFALGSNLGGTDRAATLLRQAVTGRPSFGAAHAKLADALLSLGRLHEAEQEARTALGCSGVESDWHAVMGEVQLLRGQHDDALKSAEAALRLISGNARAKLLLADAHAAKHDIDLAIEAWQAAFNLARTNPTPLVHAALGCLANQRETTAKAFADRATQGFPSWAPAWDAAGDVAAKAGDKAGARRAWQQAISATEGNVDRDAIRRKIAALGPPQKK